MRVLGHHDLHKAGFSFNRNWTGRIKFQWPNQMSQDSMAIKLIRGDGLLIKVNELFEITVINNVLLKLLSVSAIALRAAA